VACKPDALRKATVLAVFGAVRASMKGFSEAKRLFELLAIRLDLLASIGVPVERDPRISSILTRLSVERVDGLDWILGSICELLGGCAFEACKGVSGGELQGANSVEGRGGGRDKRL